MTKMRMAALAAVMAAGAALLPVTPTQAHNASDPETFPNLYKLEVAPTIACQDGCGVTVLDASLGLTYTNDSTSLSASLTQLENGARVPIEYDDYPMDRFLFATRITTGDETTPFQPGRYQLRVVADTMGMWECSEYNPDGCTWYDDERAVLTWRFNYTGGSQAFGPYLKPWTEVSARVTKANEKAKVRTFKGKVIGRIEQGDYTLTPRDGLARRNVIVQRKVDRKWRLVAQRRTDQDGRFLIRARSNKLVNWRVYVPGSATSPAASSYTDGRFRPAASAVDR